MSTPHAFDAGYTGMSTECNALIERDGYGDDCELPREDASHQEVAQETR